MRGCDRSPQPCHLEVVAVAVERRCGTEVRCPDEPAPSCVGSAGTRSAQASSRDKEGGWIVRSSTKRATGGRHSIRSRTTTGRDAALFDSAGLAGASAGVGTVGTPSRFRHASRVRRPVGALGAGEVVHLPGPATRGASTGWLSLSAHESGCTDDPDATAGSSSLAATVWQRADAARCRRASRREFHRDIQGGRDGVPRNPDDSLGATSKPKNEVTPALPRVPGDMHKPNRSAPQHPVPGALVPQRRSPPRPRG